MPDQPVPEFTPTDDLPIALPSPAEEPSPSASPPPRVLLSQTALAAIREHGYTDTAHECGGVMVGEKLDGDRGPMVLVEAVIAGAHTDNRRGSVTFTHETWEQINQEKDQNYSDLRIVGWYHTHPGFGIFLSDYDQFIQANFFNLPWNVAFVLDPLSGESGAFGWVEGKITRLPEYESYAVADEHPPAPAEGEPVAEAESEAAETAAEPESPPLLRRPLRWGIVGTVLASLVLLALVILSLLGMGLMLDQQRLPASPPPVSMPPAPVPAASPAAPGPASTEAPAPTEAPPTEAGPPPSASNQENAPAPEAPHDSSPLEQPEP